ncbi:MAG: hypothetical protein JWL85_473 [Candidatus Saccharibacteria bacterium]|nr:hypothetical protein [Candidatus Saccharibacteria bacterium]
MNNKRVFFGMIGLVSVLSIAVIVSVVLGNAMLEKKSAKLVEYKLTNKVLEQQQIALIQANKDISKYADLEKIAKSIVPQDKDQAKSVRELVKIAEESGVVLSTISFPSSTLGAAQPKPAAKTEGTAATPTAPPVTQVKTVDGIPGVYQLEINIQSDTGRLANYANLQKFLQKLEQNRRTAQVSQIEIIPKPNDLRLLSFRMVINVYIKP